MTSGIDIIKDVRKLKEFAPEWANFENAILHENLFTASEYVVPCAAILSRIPYIIVRRSAGKVRAVVPLEKTIVNTLFSGVSALQFMGNEFSYYPDIVADSGLAIEVVNDIVQILLSFKNWRVIDFRNMHEKSLLGDRLIREAGLRGFPLADRCENPCFGTGVYSSMAEYIATIRSKSLRKRMGRLRRKIEHDFDFEFRRIGKDETDEAFAKFLELHMLRIAEKKARTLWAHKDFVDFHRKLAGSRFKPDAVQMYVLNLNGETAGVMFGLGYGRTVNFINIGFDGAKYFEYSLGMLMHYMTVEKCIEENAYDYIDFLGGGEEYKTRLGFQPRGGKRVTVWADEKTRSAANRYIRLKAMAKRVLGRSG